MKCCYAHVIMTVKYSESWRCLTLSSVKCVWYSPYAATAVAFFSEFASRVFNNSKGGVCDYRMKRVCALRLQPFKAVRIVDCVTGVSIRPPHRFSFKKG